MLLPGPGGGSAEMAAIAQQFRVELEKLETTAAQLQNHVDALQGSAEGMAGSPNFGQGPGGAATLGARHEAIVKPTQQLISDIRGGIKAGEEALRVARLRYAEADAQGSDNMRRAGDRHATEDLNDRGFEEDPEYGGGRNIPI